MMNLSCKTKSLYSSRNISTNNDHKYSLYFFSWTSMSCIMILSRVFLCLGTKLDLHKEKYIFSDELEIYKF